MKKIFFFLFVLSTTKISFAQQEFVYPADDPTISISFPDHWTVSTDETSLEAFPADQSIYYGIVILQAHNVEAAITAADEAVTNMFTTITYDDPQEGEYNGIRFVFVEGRGILEEVGECDVEVGIFTVDDVDYFMSLYFGTPEAGEQYMEDLDFIVQSFKKL